MAFTPTEYVADDTLSNSPFPRLNMTNSCKTPQKTRKSRPGQQSRKLLKLHKLSGRCGGLISGVSALSKAFRSRGLLSEVRSRRLRVDTFSLPL